MSNKLGSHGINVFELVTFDPHSLSDNTTFTLKYNNVANLYNFYQRNPRTDGRFGWNGSNPYWGSPVNTSYSPNGFQIDYTNHFYKNGVYVNHLNIIKHVMGR